MRMRWDGVSPENYDAVWAKLRIDEEPPDGGYFHIAWFDGSRMRLTDVWESPAHFGRFIGNRLEPGVVAVGIETEPIFEVLHCHHFQRLDADTSHALVVDGPLNFSRDAYEQLAEKVQWKSVPPAGGVCHIVGEREDGSLVHTTAWESAAAHAAFEIDRVGPFIVEMGADPPRPQTADLRPVHAIFDVAAR